MVPGVCYGNDFVGIGGSEKLLEASFDRRFEADDGFAEAAIDGGAFEVIPDRVHGVNRWEEFDRLIADEAEEALLGCGEEAARFFV